MLRIRRAYPRYGLTAIRADILSPFCFCTNDALKCLTFIKSETTHS